MGPKRRSSDEVRVLITPLYSSSSFHGEVAMSPMKPTGARSPWVTGLEDSASPTTDAALEMRSQMLMPQ
jgi:hypothetical protein